MKAAMIAAIVAAVVAASTATATTAIVITGAQIKDGSIQAKDLSAKARKSLHGQPGPRGFAGAQGSAGAAGPAGAAGARGPAGPGMTDLEYVTNYNVATGEVGAEVQCPAGKFVVSGGGHTDTGFLDGSAAVAPQGWRVRAWSGTQVQVLNVTALCARFVAGGVVAATPSAAEFGAARH